MTRIWQQNEERDEDDELAITEHRDQETALNPDDEQSVETASESPRNALDALGEDVASSPSRRGHTEGTTDRAD